MKKDVRLSSSSNTVNDKKLDQQRQDIYKRRFKKHLKTCAEKFLTVAMFYFFLICKGAHEKSYTNISEYINEINCTLE